MLDVYGKLVENPHIPAIFPQCFFNHDVIEAGDDDIIPPVSRSPHGNVKR